MDKCSSHDEIMEKLFDKINNNCNTLTSIDSKMSDIRDFKDKLHIIIFGNGKEGLVSKVNRVCAQIMLQWGLIVLILVWAVLKSVGAKI